MTRPRLPLADDERHLRDDRFLRRGAGGEGTGGASLIRLELFAVAQTMDAEELQMLAEAAVHILDRRARAKVIPFPPRS